MSGGGCEEGGAKQEGAASIYHQHIAAGSVQDAEFCYVQDHADRTAVV